MAPSPADATAAPRRARRDLILRIASALVLAPVVLAATWHGFPFFDLLLAIGVVLAWREWRLLVGGLRRPALLLCGAAYIAAVALSLLSLRHEPETGLQAVLWLLATVWATDIFAYVAGRTLGGPKLAPRLSPKKTWSGALGGLAAAIAVGVCTAWLFTGGSAIRLAMAGGLLSLVSQAGDLAESAVKRYVGVKDSGRLIPGHGGLLDRVDALMAAAVAMAAIRLAGDARWPW
ncbi:MAG: phosphatidate cytidylyltransferase [Alphaproteobacteria bacterium]|nr:phosphatidate cytidylyltransferase [Alphaproteobacteria bacterium]MCW5740110.1 phosphatidate cytidylyltransferase [Alphaproteobacteria bacterium]